MNNKLPPKVTDLAKHTLNKYKSASYSKLALLLKEVEKHPNHVQIIDITDNNTDFQITIDANWDDKKEGHIRYDVFAFPLPIKSLFGFSFSRSIDGFIIKPDGTFLDEDE